jgi:hypothetical protein
MTTCHKQIGQRTGYEQAMSVLLEPAITHLGEAEHPLDDPDRMFDPGPHFGLGTIFRPLETRVWGDQAYRGQRAVIRRHLGRLPGPVQVGGHAIG